MPFKPSSFFLHIQKIVYVLVYMNFFNNKNNNNVLLIIKKEKKD